MLLNGESALKDLTLELLRSLVRTGCVHRVFLSPYPEINGGGWYLDVDHSDPGLGRHVATQRGDFRVFKTADAAIRIVRETGFGGSFVVVVKTTK